MQKFAVIMIIALISLSAFGQEKKEPPPGNPYKVSIGEGKGVCKYTGFAIGLGLLIRF